MSCKLEVILLGVTRFDEVLQGLTGSYEVLQGLTGSHQVFQVLPGLTAYCQVSKGLTWSYPVILLNKVIILTLLEVEGSPICGIILSIFHFKKHKVAHEVNLYYLLF